MSRFAAAARYRLVVVVARWGGWRKEERASYTRAGGDLESETMGCSMLVAGEGQDGQN